MAITPFRTGSLAGSTSDLFVSMRREMLALQRQLVTGQKADTYGGLGFERRTSLDARAKLAAIETYTASIEQADLRIKMMTQNLERLNKLALDTKSDLTVPKFEPLSDGRTFAQKTAEQRLKEAIDLLNTDLAGRSLFAGRAFDTLPVASYEEMIKGDGASAGLERLITERVQAEGGADNLGRLAVTSSASAVRIAPESPGLDFGFSVTGVDIGGSAVAASGSPPGFDLPIADFADNETVTITLNHPNTGPQTIKLTAKANPTPSDAGSSFQLVPGNVAQSIANLQSAVTAALKSKVETELLPAVTMEVADTFFTDPAKFSDPTQIKRVPGGLPAYAATTRDPAPGPVVNWYRGDADTSIDPRDTAPVRVDQSQVVGAGARANEAALANVLQQLAVTAVTPFRSGDSDFYMALSEQVYGKLADKPDNPKVTEVATEIANASATMQATKARHAATENMLLDAVDDVEKASPEETSLAILDLQTKLQASYQTTSILSQLSLVNYI
jgi:hypothetical protein